MPYIGRNQGVAELPYESLSREQLDRLGDYYLDHDDCTLKQLAEKHAISLIGFPIAFDHARFLSSREKWGVRKRRKQMGREGLPETIQDEAADMRSILYEKIMDPETNLTAQELSQLMNMWEKIKVNAPDKTSGKSGRQQIIESTQRGGRKAMKLIQGRSKTQADPAPEGDDGETS